MTEQQEELGQLIDRLDSLRAALQLPMPAQFHVDQLKAHIPQLVVDMKAAFITVTGENPWE